jgi:hypothetical protein
MEIPQYEEAYPNAYVSVSEAKTSLSSNIVFYNATDHTQA